ncbi:MAG: alpha/beta hydrolase [Rubrivivax sp.]|nr:alpha/beta hydrolase [Rubrivivax sp.]
MTHPLNLNVMPARVAAGAPTLVFAHGYGCDQGMWHEVAQALPDTQRVLFDWPGAGQADPAAYDARRHATLEGYADDLLALLDELALLDAVVVGHSVAASIAALAARRQPARFGMLAMLAPSPCFLNDPPDYLGGFDRAQLEDLVHGLAEGQAAWSRAIAPVVMGNPERPALSERLADSFCAMDPTIALRWARATFLSDLRPQMADVRVPCLVMQSRDDKLAPEAVGRWLAAQLPTSRHALLDAIGHCPHLSAPAEVTRVLQAHLSWRG